MATIISTVVEYITVNIKTLVILVGGESVIFTLAILPIIFTRLIKDKVKEIIYFKRKE